MKTPFTWVAALLLLVLPGCEPPTPALKEQLPVPLPGPRLAHPVEESSPAAPPDLMVAPELNIGHVFRIVERSGLRFEAPQRDKSMKAYDAASFAQHLRRKWRWLAKDVVDVQEFLNEVATVSYGSFRPYRVILADGQKVEFRTWIDKQLQQRSPSRANGRRAEP